MRYSVFFFPSDAFQCHLLTQQQKFVPYQRDPLGWDISNFENLFFMKLYSLLISTKNTKKSKKQFLSTEKDWNSYISKPYIAMIVLIVTSELVSSYTPSRSLRSSSKNLLCRHKTKLLQYGGRSFFSAAPMLWNELPDSVRKCESLDIFKSTLKKHLFCNAYL